MNDSQALARSISCLLDNTTLDATWGDFQVEWNPIITALTCKLLLSCGLSPDTPWYIDRNGYTRCTLGDSFKWLNNAIRPDGTFGTDFWDVAQLGIVVERFSLGSRFTGHASLKAYLTDAIHSRKFLSDQSQWQGPGFTAAAIEYARLLGDRTQVEALTKELVLQRHPKGYWHGHLDPGGAPIVSPVWHTAQCIMVLAADSTSHSDVVRKASEWLRHAQDASGAWVSVQQYKIYFTAYAILALLHDRRHDERALRKAIEYLKSQISVDGKCSDLGGTLMCALALRAVVDGDFERDITLVDYVLARKNLTRAEALKAELDTKTSELARVRADLERYEKKYGDADFAVTKKQLFLITVLGLFLTALGTVAGVYALGPLFRPSIPVEVHNPAAASEQRTPARNSVPNGPGNPPSNVLPDSHPESTPSTVPGDVNKSAPASPHKGPTERQK